MLTLLSECHFWTSHDEIRIKDTDFGAFKYTTKKDFISKNVSSVGKRDYTEKRDGIIILKNRRPTRLKDGLKKFEELLKIYKIIHSEWHDACSVRVLLSNGLLVYLCVNVYTGDLCKMAFDKYFMGKLASDVITDAVFTRQHILLSYNTNQITVVYLQKPNTKKSGPEKISNMDPKVFHVLIPGPTERKLPRHLVVNDSFDLIIIWTKSSQSEIYPWRPTIRDQDRANIHVYKLRSVKLESVAYCWTENDPISVEFLRGSDGCLLSLEQKVSRKGEITAELCSYEIGQGKMKRAFVTSIPIGTQICCHCFSPDQEKLFLGTIDRYVCVYDLPRKCTKSVSRADIIPTHCAWHPDSSLIMIANDRSQFQCFDVALSFVANQLISEDVTPSNLLDLSHYFAIQPNLLNVSFSCKPYINNISEKKYAQTDCFLFMVFENGPVGSLRFFAATSICGDVHNSGLTVDIVIGKYLSLNQLEKAVNLFLTLNWETYGAMCLISLHQIANYVFRKNEAKANRNELLNKALLSFTDGLSDETKDEFDDQVIDLKRRFFFFLLRHHLFAEAFEVARNVEDYDLFMDLFNVTKNNAAFINLSHDAYVQAELILSQSDSAIAAVNFKSGGDANSCSSCSHSSCSEYVSSFAKVRNEGRNVALSVGQHGKLPGSQYFNTVTGQKLNPGGNNDKALVGHRNKKYIPPLPYFKSSILNDENLKINIPKPELRITADGNGNGFRPVHALKQTLVETNYRQPPTKQKLSNSSQFTRDFRMSHSEPAVSIDGSNGKYPLSYSSSGQKSNSSRSQIPDQTLGIPVAMPSVKLLPRATAFTENYLHSFSQNQGSTGRHSSNNQIPMSTVSVHNLPKYYQHPLVSGTIPSTKLNTSNGEEETLKIIKKPATSILSNSSSNCSANYANTSSLSLSGGIHNKKDNGEKNKVKFSDTVQVAVVPEIHRKEKPIPPKRNGFRPPMTDSERELADSLPLCHPNDDYLKDFNPMSEPNTCNETENMPEGELNSKTSTIKVVHFGVV